MPKSCGRLMSLVAVKCNRLHFTSGYIIRFYGSTDDAYPIRSNSNQHHELHQANRDQGYTSIKETQHKEYDSIYTCMCNKIGLLLLIKIIVESSQVDNKMCRYLYTIMPL